MKTKTLKEILADRRSENEKIIQGAQSRVEEVLLGMCYGFMDVGVADTFFYVKIGDERVEVHPNKIRVCAEDGYGFGSFEWENSEVFRKLLDWQIVELDNSMSLLNPHPLLGFAERLDNQIRFAAEHPDEYIPVTYDDDDIPF